MKIQNAHISIALHSAPTRPRSGDSILLGVSRLLGLVDNFDKYFSCDFCV
jgi:hypothetical protein